MTQSISERITQLEEEIRKIPYHKGTEHHIGRLKAKLAKLKEEQLVKKFSRGGKGFAPKKSGDATVVLVGPPSVGKSTLINTLTGTHSKVADYDFTTLEVIPGILNYQGAKIQILDIPGIIEGASKGKGRGKEVLSVIRIADLILIIVDIFSLNKINQIKFELHSFGIRLNEEKPKIKIIETKTGGIKVISPFSLEVSPLTIKELAGEFKIRNAEIMVEEKNITLEKLIDFFMGNRVYLPYLVVVNKADLFKRSPSPLKEKFGEDYVLVSAKNNQNLEFLKKKIWEKLNLIRVYLMPEKDNIDFNKPLVIKKGTTLRKILENVSICNKGTFKKAKIYGVGAKFAGQEVSFDFQPQEGTIINFF